MNNNKQRWESEGLHEDAVILGCDKAKLILVNGSMSNSSARRSIDCEILYEKYDDGRPLMVILIGDVRHLDIEFINVRLQGFNIPKGIKIMPALTDASIILNGKAELLPRANAKYGEVGGKNVEDWDEALYAVMSNLRAMFPDDETVVRCEVCKDDWDAHNEYLKSVCDDIYDSTRELEYMQ